MNTKNIWWETYRPEEIAEFIGQEHIMHEMKAIVSGEAPMQNFIFHSPEPGTGKTTLAYILAKALGYEVYRYNASSKRTRGIEFIEEDVIPLSRMGLTEAIIFLDEADRLTVQAQDALKGVIEEASCYFILTCNDITRVSSWLQSRCQVRTFKPIPVEDAMRRLAIVASREGVDVNEHALETIAKAHQGDLRNSIGALQSYASQPNERERERFLLALTVNDFDCVRFLKSVFASKDMDGGVKMILDASQPARKIVSAIFDFAMNNPSNVKSKVIIIEATVQAERDIISGVRESIAVYEYVRYLCNGRM